ETDDGFMRAFQSGNGLELDARSVLVDYERGRVMKGWVPRRFGGGLGGRRESGQMRFGGRDCPYKLPFPPQRSDSNSRTTALDHPVFKTHQRFVIQRFAREKSYRCIDARVDTRHKTDS